VTSLPTKRKLQLSPASLPLAPPLSHSGCFSNEQLGTRANPMPNSPRRQVVARKPGPLPREATRLTRGGLIVHAGQPICAMHVAGALWPLGAANGKGGQDPTQTDRFITYNAGLGGKNVVPSPLGSRRSPSKPRVPLPERRRRAWGAGLPLARHLPLLLRQDVGFAIPVPMGPGSPRRPRDGPLRRQPAARSSSVALPRGGLRYAGLRAARG
jgi:hypothetical protein